MVAVSAQAAENPVLTIEGGQVQGVVADDHPDVFVYRGIPYAAPPIRENRWTRVSRPSNIPVATTPSGVMARRQPSARTVCI